MLSSKQTTTHLPTHTQLPSPLPLVTSPLPSPQTRIVYTMCISRNQVRCTPGIAIIGSVCQCLSQMSFMPVYDTPTYPCTSTLPSPLFTSPPPSTQHESSTQCFHPATRCNVRRYSDHQERASVSGSVPIYDIPPHPYAITLCTPSLPPAPPPPPPPNAHRLSNVYIPLPGAMYAGIAIIESVCQCVSNMSMMPVYKATMSFMPGFVFLVFVAVDVLAIVVYA